LTDEEAITLVDIFLETHFKADPKYQRRLDELEQLYG
jgi:ribose 5-phosphate isomerase RpiB